MKSSFVAAVLAAGAVRAGDPDPLSAAAKGRKTSQMPVRSGLPSGVFGAGAVRFGLPSAVRGTPGVGYAGHWANSAAGAHAAKVVVKNKARGAVMSASQNTSGMAGLSIDGS